MNEAMQFLLKHGYLVLAACVFGEQIGLPIHSAPIFLALGTLAASGRMSLLAALGLAVAASLAADLIWYELGRRQGSAVLRIISRISLNSGGTGNFAHNAFTRHRGTILLSAKFVPGLSMVAPPMAGMSGMPLWRFLLWDLAATIIWVGSYSIAGYFFGTELGAIARTAPAGTLGWLAVLAGCLLIGYLAASLIRSWQVARPDGVLGLNGLVLVESCCSGQIEAAPIQAARSASRRFGPLLTQSSGSCVLLHRVWRVLGRSWHVHCCRLQPSQCASVA